MSNKFIHNKGIEGFNGRRLVLNRARLQISYFIRDCSLKKVEFEKEEKTITSLILVLFLLLIISLNIAFFVLSKKGEFIFVIILGITMMILSEALGIKSGELLLRFGEGEGTGYVGAMFGLITFVNGILIILTAITILIIRVIRKRSNISSQSNRGS